jgi:hypothetical protein
LTSRVLTVSCVLTISPVLTVTRGLTISIHHLALQKAQDFSARRLSGGFETNKAIAQPSGCKGDGSR